MKYELKPFNLEEYLAAPADKKPTLCTGCIDSRKFVGICSRERFKVVAEDSIGTLLCYDDKGVALHGRPLNYLYFKVACFEVPPPGHHWYNPGKLTPEIVGPDYRLLSSADFTDDNLHRLAEDFLDREKLEFYSGSDWQASSISGYTGNILIRTYRLPIRTPFANGLVLQEDGSYQPLPWFEEIKAHKRGCRIQCLMSQRPGEKSEWITIESKNIDWNASLQFRVLPIQQLVEWTEETYPFKEGILWLKHKQADTKFLVTAYDKNGLYFGSSKDVVVWPVLKSEFIQLNNSPCGTLHDIT